MVGPIPVTFKSANYCDPMDPDCFAEVKNGWESLVGTVTEQFDPIMSPLGPRGPIRSYWDL